jgi:hypothetical protein
MPRHTTILLSLLLGAALHVDWHLARPLHHRLSLDLPYHWALTAGVFAVVGCVIARRWPSERWRHGAIVFVTAVLLAQVVEPVLEVLIYDHRLGYDVEADRWVAFGKSALASAVAYASMLMLCAPKQSAPAG